MIAPLLFVLALAPDDGAMPADRPEIREIELTGVEAFSRDEVLAYIRLSPGEPLRREPAAIAAGLERRYKLSGYPAARVEGAFDEAAGRLSLDVEEGHLLEVAVQGIDDAASRRALEALKLQTGPVLREADIWAAIARLQDASEGTVKAVGTPLWTVEPLPGGTRLVLPLTRTPAQFNLGLWSPRVQGRHNRVDGWSVGLRSETGLTNASSYNHLRLRAAGSYAFDSKKVRYSLGIHRPFGPGQRFGIGYEYHDLTDSEDWFRRYGLEEVQGDTYNSEKSSDLFRRIGHQAYLFGRIDARTQVGVSFRSDGYTSLAAQPGEDEPNPRVEEGRMRSIIGTVRFASRGDLFRIPLAERESFLFPSLYVSPAPKPERLRAEATWEISRPGLGSDFDFTRLIGRLRYHKPVADHHRLDALVYAGYTGGDPPFPKRFFLGGTGTLRGFDKKEFTGENMLMTTVEWSWLPPSRFVPAVIPFYDGGTLWGTSAAVTGWKHDVGLGLRWPQAARVFARLDAAVPLNPEPGHNNDPHWNLRLQIPF